jgi:transposase
MRQRRANRHASKWAFAELHGLLAYKAALAGSLCIKVDADYTSQACPRCGYTSRENRPRQGLLFVCQQCHFTLHADLVGARNIALRAFVIRQDWMATGKPVRCPRCDGQRSQSSTPLEVCGIAVESGHKPPALAVGSSDLWRG